MIKIYNRDLNFLSKNAREYSEDNNVLLLLNKIELGNTQNQDFYLLDLSDLESDLMGDFLTDLICEIGIGNDGEINQTGRYIDNLIDIFRTKFSK